MLLSKMRGNMYYCVGVYTQRIGYWAEEIKLKLKICTGSIAEVRSLQQPPRTDLARVVKRCRGFKGCVLPSIT